MYFVFLPKLLSFSIFIWYVVLLQKIGQNLLYFWCLQMHQWKGSLGKAAVWIKSNMHFQVVVFTFFFHSLSYYDDRSLLFVKLRNPSE